MQRYNVAVAANDRSGVAGARLGIWVGCFGWLIGLLVVAFFELPAMWLEVLGALSVTAIVAFAVDRVALAAERPSLGALFSAIAVAMGSVLLYYAVVMLPVIREQPQLVERLHALGSVVEVPIWLGAAVVAAGAVGFMLSRRAAAA